MGRLIEAVGLKGQRVGDMEFQSTHANFFSKPWNGTFEDAINLIELAKQKVRNEFDIDLEEEIIILNEKMPKVAFQSKVQKLYRNKISIEFLSTNSFFKKGLNT